MTDRSIVYRLKADITGFKGQMAAAAASVRKAGDEMTGTSKSGDKWRRGLTSLGSTAGKVGLVAAAGLGASVLAAANFDAAMSKVQAATHETTANMELLRAAAIKAGADTKFSASEAAAGVEELAKAGVSTKDILGGGLSGALSLAAAGEIDVGEAAETAASAMTQFKLGGEQVNHIADLLAAGAGKAQGSVHDLGMALNQSGLVASQTGLTIEETTGTLAAFASAGLTGSDAGTSFKQMLLSLTPTSVKSKNLMDQLGISAYDAGGNFVGMAKFADSLREALKNKSEEERNSALKTIFGSDAVRAASIVYQDGAKGIQGWIDKTNDSGYAAETAAIKMDNLKGDLEQFRGSLETALILTGEGSQGPLRSLVQNATDAVNVYTRLPHAVQGATTAVLGFTALAGGGIFVFSKLVQGANNARTALSDMGIEMSKVNKRAIAIRGGAGIAGAALLGMSGQIHSVNSTLGDFSDVAGAAMTGFAVGGPWGAALGTGVSLLSKIGGESMHTSVSMEQLTSTIDAQTGAWTDLSRQTVATDLAGASVILQQAGVDVSGLTDAVLEGGDAFQEYRAQYAAALDQTIGNDLITDQMLQKFDELRDTTAGSRQAFKASSATLGDTTGATEKYSAAAEKVSRQQQHMADRTKHVTAAMKEQRKATAEASQQWLGLGDGVNKAKVSLDDWIKHFARQAQALREFRVNAQNAAKKGLDEGLIASLHAAGPEGALRMKQLADATKEQIARANEGFRSGKREADNLSDAINKITSPKPVKVTVEDGAAMSVLQQLQNFAFRDKYIQVHTVRHDSSGAGFQHGSADGSTVPHGGPYADRYPYLLAPGEEVISNRSGQADRWRPLLKSINAGLLANGGTASRPVGVTRSVAAMSAPSVNVDLNGMRVTGTLNTPWGPSDLEAVVDNRIAAAAARR